MVSLCVGQTHLPRGSSPSSLRHLTVGAGSPCTSHRKSTFSSSITTWFTGLRSSTGRSAKTGAQSRQETGHVITHARTRRRRRRRHPKRQQKHRNRGVILDLPYTTSSAGSLSLSPTMLVPTHTYMPASLFLVWEIISLPPRI